jgi:hypothetical protein
MLRSLGGQQCSRKGIRIDTGFLFLIKKRLTFFLTEFLEAGLVIACPLEIQNK